MSRDIKEQIKQAFYACLSYVSLGTEPPEKLKQELVDIVKSAGVTTKEELKALMEGDEEN